MEIVDYKANTKDTRISSLNNLKNPLEKINNIHNAFLRRESVVDKKTNIKHTLIFYKGLEAEIEIIYRKSKLLIDNKYLNLEKMQHLLTIIIDQANLPKFL